ncbi:MAG: SUMF1/EgtB/PvdO family nonheme iron enzyme [Chloroflexota bacterium]|nr:SUMF1/EgtB/PvdO family nonheme iron enzyme [Chloroflexota bacterium]
MANPLPARQWPWGDQWDPAYCNTREGQECVGWLSPAGMFQAGLNPYGCHDLVGNVWEWTRSAYEPYPFEVRPADGSDEETVAALRVLRGGSWNNEIHNARCAVRNRNIPTNMNNNSGLRVVCAHLSAPAGNAVRQPLSAAGSRGHKERWCSLFPAEVPSGTNAK